MYVRIVVRTASVAWWRQDHVTAPGVNEYCAEGGCDEEVDEDYGESAAWAQIEDQEGFKALSRP
jgi:hypothetical protein